MAGSRSIGELNERSLHRALKERYSVGGLTEQVVGAYVADVLIGNRIVEIHTGSFSPLKRKLPRLLESHFVTLVHPIARERYIVKVGLEADAPRPRRRKSPKRGSVYEVFSGLVSIPSLLARPNLTLEVVMTVEEDIRAPREKRSWRSPRWTRIDRRLLSVAETHTFQSMDDLFADLDSDLPRLFTSRDLASAMKSSPRLARQAAYCFRKAGVSEVSGKNGNAMLYRRARVR